MTLDLMEPLKYYEQAGAQQHAQNIQDYFDELLAKSGVNVEENRSTVRAYNAEQEEIKNVEKKISKFKTLRVFLIIGIVVGAILSIVGISNFSSSVWLGILLLLVGLGAIAGFIILMVKKVNPIIKDANALRDEHVAQANELLAQAEAQMAPLNALFSSSDTFRLIEKTIPEFSFDDHYSKDHEAFLVRQHDFLDLVDAESSTVNTLAGRFSGNPFLFCQRLVHEMGEETYHGSLVITWTETYRDSNGNLQTRHRSETLHASVTKPKPGYYVGHHLGYGCQVAPDLSFTRSPQHSEALSEKALAKRIRSGEKDLKKLGQKATKQGGTFQEMANSEFDVLFGATDRDNEVQFRLMYTPLGQKNTVALLTDNKTGYGDDFYFNKFHRYNIITSEHGQGWNMTTSPANYYSYDVDVARLNFLNFNTNYFKMLFFDFAPLFSVPAYLDEPCASLEPYDATPSAYTYYEHEVMANAIGKESFVHESSATEAILKTQFISREQDADIVAVTAHSYMTVERVDYIPVYGGDGRYHNVPVPWIEYIPVEKTTHMSVESVESAQQKAADNSLPAGVLFHGIVAKTVN